MKKLIFILMVGSLFIGCNRSSTEYKTGLCAGSDEANGIIHYYCNSSLNEMECYKQKVILMNGFLLIHIVKIFV